MVEHTAVRRDGVRGAATTGVTLGRLTNCQLLVQRVRTRTVEKDRHGERGESLELH